MSVEYAVRSLIINDATLLGLWSTRYYPLKIPETPTLPCGSYQQISQVNVSSHSGNSNLAQTRLQVTVWTSGYDQGKTIRDELKRLLRDYHSLTSVAGTRLDRIIWANDLAQFEPETQRYQRIIDLMVLHNTTY